MKQLLFTLVLFVVCLGHGIAQEKYVIHGTVVCSDNLPVKNVSVTSDNSDFVGCTDSLGRFEYVTDTLPITIYFKYIGCITKSLYVDKYNYKSLLSVQMDEEVIIDFCDERGGIKVPVAELERYGKYEDILVGSVYGLDDSLPIPETFVNELDKNGKYINGTKTDIDGHFYLPLKQLPTTVEMRFIGYETTRTKITQKNIKELHDFYLPTDTTIVGCPIITTKPRLVEYGKSADMLVGSVYCSDDSLPLIGTRISALTKKGKIEYSVLADMNGKFYLPLKQLPTIVEISYIGCETIKIKITKRNITKQHKFYMQEDKKAFYCE